MLYIYGLYSDDIENIRYVGKTNNVNKRLYEHINDAKRNNKVHRQKWIRNEIKKNKNINITILEECNDLNWEEKEKFWIKYYNNLTNLTVGGEGGKISIYNISYKDAKELIKKLNIKSKNHWYRYIKEYTIENFPLNPYEVFKTKGEWISWGDFLGTNNIQDNMKSLNYISYEDAKQWIKENLVFDTIEDWKKLVNSNKIPDTIPNRPERYYKKRGWINWGDFSGTGKLCNKDKTFVSYEDAKKIINELGIKSRTYWRLLYDKEIKKYNIPSAPDKHYIRTGWINWGEFFGTGRLQDNLKALNYISYEDAKEWIKENLNISTKKDWEIEVKKHNIPNTIPNNPQLYYYKKDRGWKGWKDFLSKKIGKS